MAQVLVEGDEDPDAQEQERQANHAAHERVDPVGQDRSELQRDEPQREHDDRVPQRVQRAEHDRPAPLEGEPGTCRAMRPTRVQRRVRLLAGVGGRGRRGDVRDRCDVVPVEPVPDAEHQTGREHCGAAVGDGEGKDSEERFDHGVELSLAWCGCARAGCDPTGRAQSLPLTQHVATARVRR
jgi:hypothetical protein